MFQKENQILNKTQKKKQKFPIFVYHLSIYLLIYIFAQWWIWTFFNKKFQIVILKILANFSPSKKKEKRKSNLHTGKKEFSKTFPNFLVKEMTK